MECQRINFVNFPQTRVEPSIVSEQKVSVLKLVPQLKVALIVTHGQFASIQIDEQLPHYSNSFGARVDLISRIIHSMRREFLNGILRPLMMSLGDNESRFA